LIVGYDRTESARLAAAWAARQLQPEGKLVIVHACRPLHAQPSPLSSATERRELGRALIDELLMDTNSMLEIDIDIEAEVSDRDPVSALIEAARHHTAQGIVVGHEQHSTLHRALGTVTSELLSTSPVPVITVPLSAAEASGQALGGNVRAARSMKRPRLQNRP
jgi:nucleotide-binding universal stress UspA family protein